MSKVAQLPVTILTGFLGAGKTSLLNQLIQEFPEKRFAILENEFGEESVDAELVVEVAEGIFELNNGCICCSLNAELGDMLLKLAEERDRFDHLIIETTGIANPAEIVGVFLAEPSVKPFFRVESVLCILDAVNFMSVLEDQEEIRHQLIYADQVLINKADVVNSKQLKEIRTVLKAIVPMARIDTSVMGIPTDGGVQPLLGRDTFDPDRVQERISMRSTQSHQHGDIVSHSFRFSEPVDPIRFGHWVQQLLLIQGARFYRIKGLLQFPFREHQLVFQSVGKRHIFSKGRAWGDGESRESHIVFIGKGLRRDVLEKGLKNCRWVDPFED